MFQQHLNIKEKLEFNQAGKKFKTTNQLLLNQKTTLCFENHLFSAAELLDWEINLIDQHFEELLIANRTNRIIKETLKQDFFEIIEVLVGEICTRCGDEQLELYAAIAELLDVFDEGSNLKFDNVFKFFKIDVLNHQCRTSQFYSTFFRKTDSLVEIFRLLSSSS